MSWNVLFSDSARHWLRPKGIAIVLLAVLVPPALTAAWVFTHQDDVAVTELTWEPEAPTRGANMTFHATITNHFDHAVDDFNVTVRVGYYETDFRGELVFRQQLNVTRAVSGLGGGETRVLDVDWVPGQDAFGTYLVEVNVDPDDRIKEIEERNNHRSAQIILTVPDTVPELPPGTPPPAGNGTLPVLEAAVTGIRMDPETPFQGDRPNVTVTVRNDGPDDLVNATVVLRLFTIVTTTTVEEGTIVDVQQRFQPEGLPVTGSIDVRAGETNETTLQVGRALRVAPYAIAVDLYTDAVADGDAEDNNFAVRVIRVDREVLFQEPVAKADAKAFYTDVLELLHFRLLIPLIALFFAAGVLERERQEGNLPYLLTRPVPRWALPVSRYAVGAVAAGVALLLGVAITFLLLLGMPQEAPGFFGFPLLFSWLALLVYAALFTLLGIVTERPYIWGLAYVLGWETLVAFGRSTEFINVGGEPLLQDWIEYTSLNQLVLKVFHGWDPATATWTGGSAQTALYILLGIGAVALAMAASAMRRKEFPADA